MQEITKSIRAALDETCQVLEIRIAELARRINVKPPVIHQWRKGSRPVPPHRCVQLEKLVDNKVNRKRFRPEDWMRFWPE